VDAAKYDWFLYIDSDETISDGLREDIRRITSQPLGEKDPLVYRVPYGILMDGRPIKYSSSFPGYQHRFFNKKSGARFHKPVHERIEVRPGVVVGTLAAPWYVHSTREEWVHYLRETAKYRQLELPRVAEQSLLDYIRFVGINLRTSLLTLVRAAWIYARYGFKDTLPVRGELGRALNPILLIADVTRVRFFGHD
jgi:hypothetical protein